MLHAARERRTALFTSALIVSVALLLSPGALPAPARAAAGENPAQAEAASGEAPGVTLSATERQAAERLRAAWALGRSVGAQLWEAFDPNSIPALIVERRPGRAPYALLIGHPAPPAPFVPAVPAGEEGPAVHRADTVSLPSPIRCSPPLLGGARTAVYAMGETIPDAPAGEASAEVVVARLLHEMVHVFQIASGVPADLVAAEAPAGPRRAEALALAALEGRILTEFLYTDRRQAAILSDLAGQFAVVRQARWALIGAAADYERRAEIYEGPALFTELEIASRTQRRIVEAPPVQGADPSYAAFRYALVPRVQIVLAPLLATPTEPAHVIHRSPRTGAALATVLDRLGIEWRGKVLRPEASFTEILESALALDAAGRAAAFQQARERFSYEGFLDLARERLEFSGER